jgi:hypothetical protein
VQACLGETGCPVCEQSWQANELLFGSGGFRFLRRLTGFRRARNIVRIRTKCPGGETHEMIDAVWPTLPCTVTCLAVRQFDAGL